MGFEEVEGKLEDAKEGTVFSMQNKLKNRIKRERWLPSLILQLYSHSLIIPAYSVLSSPLNKTIFITPLVQIAENHACSEEIIIPT